MYKLTNKRHVDILDLIEYHRSEAYLEANKENERFENIFFGYEYIYCAYLTTISLKEKWKELHNNNGWGLSSNLKEELSFFLDLRNKNQIHDWCDFKKQYKVCKLKNEYLEKIDYLAYNLNKSIFNDGDLNRLLIIDKLYYDEAVLLLLGFHPHKANLKISLLNKTLSKIPDVVFEIFSSTEENIFLDRRTPFSILNSTNSIQTIELPDNTLKNYIPTNEFIKWACDGSKFMCIVTEENNSLKQQNINIINSNLLSFKYKKERQCTLAELSKHLKITKGIQPYNKEKTKYYGEKAIQNIIKDLYASLPINIQKHINYPSKTK